MLKTRIRADYAFAVLLVDFERCTRFIDIAGRVSCAAPVASAWFSSSTQCAKRAGFTSACYVGIHSPFKHKRSQEFLSVCAATSPCSNFSALDV